MKMFLSTRQLASRKNLDFFKISCCLMGTHCKLSKTTQSELVAYRLQFRRANWSVQSESTSVLTEPITDTNSAFLEAAKQSGTKKGESLETIYRIYAKITKERSKTHKNMKLLCEEECLKILGLLIQYRIPEEEISHFFSEFPVLLTFSHSIWEESVKRLLKNYQFNPQQLLPLLAGTPSILEGSSWKTLNDVIALLRGWGIREGKMQMVVIKNPDLLRKNVKTILNNYGKLCEVFTKSNVISLVLSNPIILTDEWEVTYSKISYVFERMGAKTSEILKSHMFKHSLERIITRHEFLERAGLYSMPDKHGISRCENAPLRNITDSDNKAFAKLVAGLTHEEYMVFVDLKRQELEEVESVDTDIEDETSE